MVRPRDFGRAWKEIEIDDDGEVVFDVQPVPCPTCQHPLELGGLDDIDVHRCGFCQKRSRFLWSDRRGIPVHELRTGQNPDWGEESWDELWRNFEDDNDDSEAEDTSDCVNGCEDPVFGGPAGEVCERGRWVCAVCGCGETDEPEESEEPDE